MAIALRAMAIVTLENWGSATAYSYRSRVTGNVLTVLAMAIAVTTPLRVEPGLPWSCPLTGHRPLAAAPVSPP